MNVAVIGASNKPDRYAYKALMLLKEKGHKVYPVHPRLKEIEGMPVFPSLNDVNDPVDTVTLYVSADVSDAVSEDIIGANPSRIIFNAPYLTHGLPPPKHA